jgi:hypothetical protein
MPKSAKRIRPAHDPKPAKRVGADQKTAKEFNQSDKGKGIIKPKGKGRKR